MTVRPGGDRRPPVGGRSRILEALTPGTRGQHHNPPSHHPRRGGLALPRRAGGTAVHGAQMAGQGCRTGEVPRRVPRAVPLGQTQAPHRKAEDHRGLVRAQDSGETASISRSLIALRRVQKRRADSYGRIGLRTSCPCLAGLAHPPALVARLVHSDDVLRWAHRLDVVARAEDVPASLAQNPEIVHDLPPHLIHGLER